MVFVIHWHESAMELHVFPIPIPASPLPLYPIPLGLPSAPGPSTCLMHPASCQAILRLPVSLDSYLSKNSVLFHVYTSQSVCSISHFSEYMKAIQELPYLSTIKSTNYLQWYLFPGFSMYLQQKLPPSSHQRTILAWVIWISTPLFLRTVLWFFFSLTSRISFSTGLFLSAYKHAIEWPAFFFSLDSSLLHIPLRNVFILDSS